MPRATTALLERLGHEVVFQAAQTCCGQMHTNNGYQRDALGLVRHHVEVFERALDGGVDADRQSRQERHGPRHPVGRVGCGRALGAADDDDHRDQRNARRPPEPPHAADYNLTT